MRISRFTAEVMEHLSTTEWKAALELLHEIMETRRSKRRGKRTFFVWIVSLFSEPLADVIEQPFAEIYIALEILHSEGWAEWRWRDDPPEKLEARGGHRRTEWRLTQDGRRIRASLPQAQERGDEILLPSPA